MLIFFRFFLFTVRFSTDGHLFSGFSTVFRKVSRFRSFFRRFQSDFGVLSFFLCFFNVFSNFLLVFLVYCPILYRRTPFFWFFNGFSQSQPYLVAFQAFLERFKLFSLLSLRFFEFSFPYYFPCCAFTLPLTLKSISLVIRLR